ncbi:hypothetical protein HYFRA_00013940 [Hymenoscyphus fraxineus]|uniref:Short-chain dehydrogenase n=1 Tax=Hymenoscyphus fraxineus TaxID=746836 RepID=A0A9N9PZW6_9HELO|nr:hypothetical protein HYFRA_00013940 [Hymenoscyphus fraxineus]
MSHYDRDTPGDTIVSDFPSQVKGRTFLITGPSDGGIGAEAAKSLARGSPKTLILVGRSLEKIQPTIDAIQKADASVAVKFVTVELSSLSSVREAAKTILEDSSIPKIDVIINNAAIMVCPYGLSKDGYELQFATNYLSHFLLTNLLLPKVLAAGPGARIINVSSTAHLLGPINFDSLDYNKGKDYDPWIAYGQAKTGNVLFSVALDKRLKGKGVKSFALCPGGIGTNLSRYMSPDILNDILTKYSYGIETIGPMKSLQAGCSTTLRAALDPSLLEADDSLFLSHCQLRTDPSYVAPHALSEENAERLWSLSEELVGEKFTL